MNNITVLLNRTHETIDIYDGPSPFTKDRPFFIPFERCHEVYWLLFLQETDWADLETIGQVGLAINQVRRGKLPDRLPGVDHSCTMRPGAAW